jgi:RecB family exonuclease
VTAALAALREAAGGGRGGADGFLAALGYEAGADGERSLLEALRRLRAAFVAQQRRSLGRTVWRARWTEVAIALAEGTHEEERGGGIE